MKCNLNQTFFSQVIKDDKLLCFVAVLVALDLGFLGLWFGLDQPMCFVSPKEYLPGMEY